MIPGRGDEVSNPQVRVSGDEVSNPQVQVSGDEVSNPQVRVSGDEVKKFSRILEETGYVVMKSKIPQEFLMRQICSDEVKNFSKGTYVVMIFIVDTTGYFVT